MKRTAINFFAAAVLVFGATAAFGQTADSPVNNDNITATVTTNCTIGTFDLDFGNYDPTSATATDIAGSVQVRCTKGTAATVTMDLGLNGDRSMAGPGADFLQYDIYSDATRTLSWPDATPGVSVTAALASATVTSLDVYGRIPAQQAIVAGAYDDTVVATVNW